MLLLLPRPRGQPCMEEQRRGHKQKKRVLAKGGTQKERGGIEGVEWLRKIEEGRVEAVNGGDMMVHKSPVAD